MAAVLLALASSVTWGVADFSGGMLARRLPLAAVTIFEEIGGLVLLVAFCVARGGLDWHSVWVGAIGGIGGGIGVATFYAALAHGTMSIVSPLVACSAVVPVGLALGTGERPSALVLGGSAVALIGAVLASAEERSAGETGRRQAIWLAAVAALGIGIFVFFLGRASQNGSVLSALLGARVASIAVLLVWVVATRATLRVSPGAVPVIFLVGVADLSANALFALASQRGLLSVVSVLGSLFPVVTVLLAHLVLHERISRAQLLGIAVALVGVTVVAAA